jgi:hypothetical protein
VVRSSQNVSVWCAGGQRVRRGVGAVRARHLRDGLRGGGATGSGRGAGLARQRVPGAPRPRAAAPRRRAPPHATRTVSPHPLFYNLLATRPGFERVLRISHKYGSVTALKQCPNNKQLTSQQTSI